MRRVAKKRRYVDNTVKGTRRGSRWPEETKTGAMCDLLVGNNLSAVARKYGVPESTLRTWMSAAHKLDAGGRKSLFDQERERQIRALQHKAAAGARASVEYINRRFDLNARNTEIYEQSQRLVDQIDGISVDGDEQPTALTTPGGVPGAGDREKLLEAMNRHRPMSDFAAANYLRALVSVTGKAAEMLGEDSPGDGEISVKIEIV